MAVLLKTKTTPRKRAMRAGPKAWARYQANLGKTGAKARAKRVAGVVEPPKSVRTIDNKRELPKSMKRTATERYRGSDAYKNWPVPQVRVTPPINEKPTRFRRTGIKSSHGGSLAPGLKGGVDPGLFRKPEHFAPEQTPEEEEEEVVDEMTLHPDVQRIVDLMNSPPPKEPSPFAGMFGESNE